MGLLETLTRKSGHIVGNSVWSALNSSQVSQI